MNHRFRSEGDNDGRTAPTDLLCLPLLLLLTFPENLAPLTGGIVCFAPILECYSQLSLFIIVFLLNAHLQLHRIASPSIAASLMEM